jgi:hypothetical protein
MAQRVLHAMAQVDMNQRDDARERQMERLRIQTAEQSYEIAALNKKLGLATGALTMLATQHKRA